MSHPHGRVCALFSNQEQRASVLQGLLGSQTSLPPLVGEREAGPTRAKPGPISGRLLLGVLLSNPWSHRREVFFQGMRKAALGKVSQELGKLRALCTTLGPKEDIGITE